MAGVKRHYDLVFSIGARCACSSALRNANLQFSSFPFDWVACSSFHRRVQMLVGNFDGWLAPDKLAKRVVSRFSTEAVIENDETKMLFVHDFAEKGTIAEQLPKIEAKYARRIERLYQKIALSSRVLIVWVNMYAETAEPADFAWATEALRKKWPGVRFDFLSFRDAPGIGVGEARSAEVDNLRTVMLDYHDPRETMWAPNHRVLTEWLLKNYTATDYRTPAEKTAFKHHLARHEYERYSATGWFDLLLTKYSYKIYKHLRTRLERKGLI